MAKAVLLDSGFLIRLMNSMEPLHQVALNLFKEYVTNNIVCCVSTVALAEYGVKGDLRFLPTKYLQYIPFQYSVLRMENYIVQRLIWHYSVLQ